MCFSSVHIAEVVFLVISTKCLSSFDIRMHVLIPQQCTRISKFQYHAYDVNPSNPQIQFTLLRIPSTSRTARMEICLDIVDLLC